MAPKAVEDKFRVVAVLVTHNGALWLPEVVAALGSQTRPIDFISAIDTGSTDLSTKLLKSARIPFITTESDSGFGKAVSLVVQTLPECETDEWIWLIHDDCAPAPTALAQLLAAVQDRPQVVMAGPKLLGWHDRTHLLEAGVSIAGNGARWTGLETNEYDQGQHDGNHDVLAVSTAGALIRRDVFEELGGLDPNLTLFRDDVDFGWRVRIAGHSVLAATNAVAYHAQAAANERRIVDVEGALLHRPLLLDRRNAAYVLLANSSGWLLPWLIIQLLGSAFARAIGYLLLKLPGYAGDELLAISTLLIKPQRILHARRLRKKHRFVSSRIVAAYIPPRWSQIRHGSEHVIETLRSKLFRHEQASQTSSVLESNEEDEDLLTPVRSNEWVRFFKRPEILGFLTLGLITLINSRQRFGDLVGGALALTPEGARDLWRLYFESWHQVGMGSSSATPTWVAIIALGSIFTLGNASFFVTVLFLAAPLLIMGSALFLLKKLTQNLWISIPAAFLYAISPVTLAAISSGRLATLVILMLAPIIVTTIYKWETIEEISWRKIFTIALLLSVLYAFTLMAFVVAFIGLIVVSISDYEKHAQLADDKLYANRLKKRAAVVLVPFLVNIPYSLEAIVQPSRFLVEPGIAIPGAGVVKTVLGDPGGLLPIWLVSPILLVLFVSLFSSTNARRMAEYGIGLLALATVISSIDISTHGNEASTRVWAGPVIALATLAAICAGTVLLDRLRPTLVLSHVHYRHYLAAFFLFTTIVYGVMASLFSITTGAQSLVQANRATVMPAFLNVEGDVKILVLREVSSANQSKIQFFISRGKDISMGDPDVAPKQTDAIAQAALGLIDGSGITSSTTLSDYGIKYVFAKAPIKKETIRAIDGLGGFTRTSETAAGVVWQVARETGRLIFKSENGMTIFLETGIEGARTNLPSAGTLVLTETYNRSWQVLQDGFRLERSKNEQGLPIFKVEQPGEISLIHDGTIRRGWISLQLIFFVTLVVLALPSGRRKREISDKELA
jgi:GT2 family glycosyltransferase